MVDSSGIALLLNAFRQPGPKPGASSQLPARWDRRARVRGDRPRSPPADARDPPGRAVCHRRQLTAIRKPPPGTAIDEQPVHGSKAAPSSGARRQEAPAADGSRLATLAALQLLSGDLAPQRIDDYGRVAGYLLNRALQMFCPEPQPGLARDGGVARTTFISVSLKNECSLRLADPIVSQASSTIPILAWT